MRHVGLLFVVGLLGCAKLNAAYGEDADDGTGGEGGSASTGGEVDPGTTGSSASATTGAGPGSNATTDVDPTTGPGGTAVDPQTTGTEGPGSETSTEGSGGITTDGRVVFLWASTNALSVGSVTPSALCQQAPPARTNLCAMSPTPLVSAGASVLAQLLSALGVMFEREVHGLYGDGTQPLALSPQEALEELLVPLFLGDTGLGDNEPFWTGTDENCVDWSTVEANGTIGSSGATDATWQNAGTASCVESLRMLCFCLSAVDPFG